MRLFLFRSIAKIGFLGLVSTVHASSEPQGIYRCGNVYTNQPDPIANCQMLLESRVTVIEGTHVQGPQAVSPVISSSANSVKVDSTEQHQRDKQAQAVLQAELQKTQRQYTELLREWNNGKPQRHADEQLDPQKFHDRMEKLRTDLQRTEADMAGLQRELSRLSVPSTTGTKP